MQLFPLVILWDVKWERNESQCLLNTGETLKFLPTQESIFELITVDFINLDFSREDIN